MDLDSVIYTAVQYRHHHNLNKNNSRTGRIYIIGANISSQDIKTLAHKFSRKLTFR